MRDQRKTKAALIRELGQLRERNAELEAPETERRQIEEALRESEEKLRSILDSASDAIIYLDELGMIIEVNKKGTDIFGYAPRDAIGRSFTEFKFVPPEIMQDMIAELSSVFSTGGEGMKSLEAIHKDGSKVFIEAKGRLIERDNGTKGVLVVMRDVTHRKLAEKSLREREEHFLSLIENATDGITIVSNEGEIVYESPSTAPIFGYKVGEVTGKDIADYVHQDDVPRLAYLVAQLQENPGEAIHEEVRVMHKDGSWRVIEGVAKNLIHDPAVNGVVYYYRDTTEGRREEERRAEHAAALAMAKVYHSIRNQEALEQARGELRAAAQLRMINEVSHKISSMIDLDELLTYVAGSLQEAFDYYNVSIFLCDSTSGNLLLKASAGGYPGVVPLATFINVGEGMAGRAVQLGEGLLANDVRHEPNYCFSMELTEARSEVAVPLKIGATTLGVLDIKSANVGAFDKIDMFYVQTLADQLAVAVHNAQLYEQAQEIAAMRERQRLARDLHDAVKQTLFSACLIAEVLPDLWQRDPTEGLGSLKEMHGLVRGALAEMQTLLFELRPAALMDTSVDELLRQLTEAVANRSRISITLTVEGDGALPADVQVAFYRITQEALSNVSKHSGATEATVKLLCQPGSAELQIYDNGCGFDLQTMSPEHFGIGIMQERAEAIGATLSLKTDAGRGTEVVVAWPQNEGTTSGKTKLDTSDNCR